jgi:L-ascorbate metabolism protein UlaG (beta-lactamase superfamily)
MHLTHYGHACLLVETDHARLLIDPGTLSSGFESLTGLDAVLVTHEHPDHVDVAAVRLLLASNPDAVVVVDEVTAPQLADVERLLVARPGETLEIADERVEVLGGTHAPVYADVPGCPNLAYLVGGDAFLHPGDALVVPPRPVQVLAVPIDGPWLKLAEAVDYVAAVRPAVAVPIHEGELTDPAKYAGMLAAFTGDAATVTRLEMGARTDL